MQSEDPADDASVGDDHPLPNAHLIATTQLVAELIAEQEKREPRARDMGAYVERTPLAGDAAIAMVPIPGGEFSMGSPAEEPMRGADEGPRRPVRVEPFWMGKFEITWASYRAFMENGKSRNKDGTLNRDNDLRTSDPVFIKDGETVADVVTQPTPPYIPMHFGMAEGIGYGDHYPAVAMSQHAASKFCQWLSAQTGHFYRLPTEAEWEYAARAGTTTAYSFGDDASQLGAYAWFFENAEVQYQKVGSRKPNPWGLHDMYGNVAEHCLDQYERDGYRTHPGPKFIPPRRAYPTVVRGGHFDSDAADLRSASRAATQASWNVCDPDQPRSRWYLGDAPWIGFRIVRPLRIPAVEEMHRCWETGASQ